MIRTVIFQRRSLDREALGALFRQRSDFQLVGAPHSEWETVAVCRIKRPDLVVLDVSFAAETAKQLAASLLDQSYVKHVILLSDEPSDVWNAEVRAMRDTSYVSRTATFDEMLKSITAGGRRNGAEGSLSSGSSSILQSSNEGRPPAVSRKVGLADLSAREVQVLRLLVEGHTAGQCAKCLRLSASTVGNHRTRIMKKLNLHRTIDLTRFAIREGLVIP